MEDVHSEFCPSLWTFFILQIKEQPGKMRNSGGICGTLKSSGMKMISFEIFFLKKRKKRWTGRKK